MRRSLTVLWGWAAILLALPASLAVATAAASSTSMPPPPGLTVVPPPPSGSYPDFVFVADAPGNPNLMTIDLGLAQTGAWNVPNTTGTGIYDPEHWVVVFYFNNITVPTGKTVKFKNHPSRAAVAFLAYDSIAIQGSLNVDGAIVVPTYSLNGVTSEPGPGGFRGGRNPIGNEYAHAGLGPGGAFSLPPSPAFHFARSGSHATAGLAGSGAPLAGPVYGNVAVTQLIGGSGSSSGHPGGYGTAYSGGGGGGAILMAANQTIDVVGSILARGGVNPLGFGYSYEGAGGVIRLVAGSVTVTGQMNAFNSVGSGGEGRIRIERNNFGGIPANVQPLTPNSIVTGNAHNSVLFETINRSTLRIVSVGGQSAPLDPRAGVLGTEPADLFSPGPGKADVVIEGRNIPLSAPVYLRATAVAGTTGGELSVIGLPSGNDTLWTRTISVDFGGGYTCLQARAVLP